MKKGRWKEREKKEVGGGGGREGGEREREKKKKKRRKKGQCSNDWRWTMQMKPLTQQSNLTLFSKPRLLAVAIVWIV